MGAAWSYCPQIYYDEHNLKNCYAGSIEALEPAPLTDTSQGGGDKCVNGLQEIRLQKESSLIGTWNVCTLNYNRIDVLIHV